MSTLEDGTARPRCRVNESRRPRVLRKAGSRTGPPDPKEIRHMRFAPVAAALLVAAAASPIAAQDGSSRGRGAPGRLMNPLAFEGPPPTVEFSKIVSLTQAQQPKYEALRKS